MQIRTDFPAKKLSFFPNVFISLLVMKYSLIQKKDLIYNKEMRNSTALV